MNPEKLAKLQASARAGGKGTPRRKVPKKTTVSKPTVVEDKKLTGALKKLGVQPIGAIEEANIFKADGSVVHLTNPGVQASLNSNTFVFSGKSEEKPLTDLLPGILSQMGNESLNALRKMAEQLSANPELLKNVKIPGQPDSISENDIPELVENFDQTKI